MENGSQQSVTEYVREKLQIAYYRINGMKFPVRILDARKVWGRVDVLVEPVGGEGSKWVEKSAISVKE